MVRVARMGQKAREMCTVILVVKAEGRRSLGKSRSGRTDDI